MQAWGLFRINEATNFFFTILHVWLFYQWYSFTFLFSLDWKIICKIGLRVYTSLQTGVVKISANQNAER